MEKIAIQHPRFHFLVGTPGIVTVHTKEIISKGDTIKAGSNMLLVEAVKVYQTSSYYVGCNFYELKFQIV